MDEILCFCEAERDWVVETTTALVRLESPTPDKGATDRCGEELASRLRAIGAAVETERSETTGDHLRATFGSGASQLLLLGHYDTVWSVGQVDRMPIHREGGKLYGPGVFDMKAGIAIGMLAMRALEATARRPQRRVTLLLTADEEHGSGTSRSLVEAEARRSDAVLVLEPSLPGGALKTARKGVAEYELTVRGVAAHAGLEPETGSSAIAEIAHQVVAIEALGDRSRGLTVNVGVIAGGSRANVVPEHARALVDARAETAADAQRLDLAIRDLRPVVPGTTFEVRGGFSRPPYQRTEQVVRLYEIARTVASELGHDLPEGAAGGGSDGNLTAALGIPTLDGLGAVGDGAHALHEHVEIDQLPWRAALVAGLVDRIGADGGAHKGRMDPRETSR